ncbi:MAG: hypothetical protein ACFCBW_18610, partial [Candidatus Competibacterales bacterium]
MALSDAEYRHFAAYLDAFDPEHPGFEAAVEGLFRQLSQRHGLSFWTFLETEHWPRMAAGQTAADDGDVADLLAQKQALEAALRRAEQTAERAAEVDDGEVAALKRTIALLNRQRLQLRRALGSCQTLAAYAGLGLGAGGVAGLVVGLLLGGIGAIDTGRLQQVGFIDRAMGGYRLDLAVDGSSLGP